MTIEAAGSTCCSARRAPTTSGTTSRSRRDIARTYDLMKFGPTSANSSPARFVFIRTQEGKEKLRPGAVGGQHRKTMAAPVTAIVAYDPKFYEKLPKLFPHNPDAESWFTSNDSLAATTAFRNGTLQGAYLIIAARALGLDTGAMSGFDNAKVDEAFLGEQRLAVELPGQSRLWRSGRACSRARRASTFDEACGCCSA